MSAVRQSMILEVDVDSKGGQDLKKTLVPIEQIEKLTIDAAKAQERLAKASQANLKAIQAQAAAIKATPPPPKPLGLGAGGGLLGGGAPPKPPGLGGGGMLGGGLRPPGLGGGGMLGGGPPPKKPADDATPVPAAMAAALAAEKKVAAEEAELRDRQKAEAKADAAEELAFKKEHIRRQLALQMEVEAQRAQEDAESLARRKEHVGKKIAFEKWALSQDAPDARSRAIFSNSDQFDGITESIRRQKKELAILMADFTKYSNRLAEAKTLAKEGKFDSSFVSAEAAIKSASDKVQEYTGYVSITIGEIERLEDIELSARRKLNAAIEFGTEKIKEHAAARREAQRRQEEANKNIKMVIPANHQMFLDMQKLPPQPKRPDPNVLAFGWHKAIRALGVAEDKIDTIAKKAADADDGFFDDVPDSIFEDMAEDAGEVVAEVKKVEAGVTNVKSNLDAAVEGVIDFNNNLKESAQAFEKSLDKHEQSEEYAKQAAEHAAKLPKNIRDVLMLEEKRVAKKKDYQAALRGEDKILKEIKDLHEKSKNGDEAAAVAMMKKSEELQQQQKLVRQLRTEHEGLRQDILNGERAHQGAARIISELREGRKDDASNNGPPGGGPGGPGGPDDPNEKIAESSKKAKEAQTGLMATIKSGWSSFGGFIGPFSAALQTGISGAWYLKQGLEFFRDGSLSAGIREATAALDGFVDKQGIAAATGGVLSAREAAQAGMRGASMGLRGGDNAAAAEIAAIAANMKVLHGEATSLKEAMMETLQGVQTELASGEIGENLKKAGVHGASYNQALAQEAARRGVLVEALDAQTKQQILLASATNDTTDKLAALRNEGLEEAAHVDNYVAKLRERVGEMMSEAAGGGGGVEEAKKRLKYLEGQANSKGSVLQGTKEQNVTPEQLEQARADLDAAIAKQEAMRKQFAKDIITQDADLFAGAASQMGEDGLEQIEQVRAGFKAIAATGDLTFNLMDPKQVALAQDIEIALAGMSGWGGTLKKDFWDMARANLSAKDAAEALLKFEAALVPKLAEDAKNKKLSLEFELKNNLQLDMASKRELAGKAAALAIDEQVYDLAKARGMTYDQTQEILNSSEIVRRKELATMKAQLATQLTLGDNLTKIQKDWYTTLGTVQDVKLQANELTETTTEYRIQVGKAAGIQFFEKLGGHIGFSTEKLGGLAKMLGVVAGNLDNLTNGSILTDNFLGRIWSKVDKIDATKDGAGKKTGSGSSKDDDMLEKLRRERIERQIEDAGRVRDGVERSYSHQFDFIDNNLKNVSKIWKDTYGEDGYIDQETVAGLASIEWAHIDMVKSAGDNAEKIKAINGALADKVAEIHEAAYDRMMRYAFDSLYALEGYAVSGMQLAGAKVLQGVEYIAEKLRENEAMARAAQTENFEAMQRVSGPGLGMISSFGDKDKDGDRGATKEEIAKQRELANLQKSYNEALELHAFTEEQKAQITAQFIRQRYDLERELDNLRFSENSRLRKQEIDNYKSMIAESQELMSSFSDEARSTAEGSKATFQGGLSQAGKDLTTLMDAGMASGIGLLGIMDEVDLMQKNMRDAEKTGIGSVAKGFAGMIGAAGAAADGIIKNEKIKAGIKGAVHTAESIGSYAEGNILGGTMHALAAVKFFAIAASAGAAGATGEAKKAEATKRTALSNNTVMLSRDRGPSVLTQVFIELQPLTGAGIVRTMNRDAATTRGQAIDSRWTRPMASVRTDL